jgi:hypothetical protein
MVQQEPWFAPGLFSQTVPKPLGAVGVSLWNPLRSGPSPLLRLRSYQGLINSLPMRYANPDLDEEEIRGIERRFGCTLKR